MKLSEMITEFRLQVPTGVDAGISDSVLTTLLNRGVIEVNLESRVYVDYAEFSASAEQQIFNISEISELSGYLGMGNGIVYYKNSNNKYVEIYPKTKKWFNERIADWRTAASGDPQYYFIKSDQLVFDRPLSTARTIRFEEYIKKPNPMDDGDDYPWTGSATEKTTFLPLDQAIIAYAKWRVQPALGKDEQGNYRGGSTYSEFKAEVRRGKRLVDRRTDLYHLGLNKMEYK